MKDQTSDHLTTEQRRSLRHVSRFYRKTGSRADDIRRCGIGRCPARDVLSIGQATVTLRLDANPVSLVQTHHHKAGYHPSAAPCGETVEQQHLSLSPSPTHPTHANL